MQDIQDDIRSAIQQNDVSRHQHMRTIWRWRWQNSHQFRWTAVSASAIPAAACRCAPIVFLIPEEDDPFLQVQG